MDYDHKRYAIVQGDRRVRVNIKDLDLTMKNHAFDGTDRVRVLDFLALL